jgi:hypothetical protein
VQEKILSSAVGRQFVFNCTRSACDFLLQEGTDAKFGARHLKRSIDRHLLFPLANLITTKQIRLGNPIIVDFTMPCPNSTWRIPRHPKLKALQGELRNVAYDPESKIFRAQIAPGSSGKADLRVSAH